MKSHWNDLEAATCEGDLLKLRVYTSRLLGKESDLVLHGGGNTSVKAKINDVFGDEIEVLFVKGSGWDLATIESAGFAPVRLEVLQRMAELPELSDSEMVKWQRAAMLDPEAPSPSVEAILHSIIPFVFVDHTHADAVVTITNTPGGEERIRALYGDRVLVVPYVMPGFILAKTIYEMTRNLDWSRCEAMVLLNHGVFTFSDDARQSYERMIAIVSEAEGYLSQNAELAQYPEAQNSELSVTFDKYLQLASLRKAVSELRDVPVIAVPGLSKEEVEFASRDDLSDVATQGPLTPDHVIRTKRTPLLVMNNDIEAALGAFAAEYERYFEKHAKSDLTMLDCAPRWAVWPGVGCVYFGRSIEESNIIRDIAQHTIKAIRMAECLDAWQALPEKEIFDVEYWELEQVKLRRRGSTPVFQGKVALVTGAASGIGRACVESLLGQGAAVVALDLSSQVLELFDGAGCVGVQCDVTDCSAVQQAIAKTVSEFGGLDVLVSNAGVFPESATLQEMDQETWNQSIAVNLTSHQIVLNAAIPFLAEGVDAAAIFVGSKNVAAPGPGAGAYSIPKAGLSQLARIAALELAGQGIRVNVLHPNQVFDTAIWSESVLTQRAEHYGLSVEEYKTNNLLKVEITSRDVAELVCNLASPVFSKTTGVQIAIDGGNERVI